MVAATAAAATDAQKEAPATDEAKKTKTEAEASAAAATSGKKEAKDKEEEILAIIHERRTIKKEEKERIREEELVQCPILLVEVDLQHDWLPDTLQEYVSNRVFIETCFLFVFLDL